MIVTCPRCFSYDDVAPARRLPEGLLEFRCTGDHDGTGPYVWSAVIDVPAPTASAARTSGSGRLASATRPASASRPASAGRAAGRSAAVVDSSADELLEPLLGCVTAGEPFVEYGIVEYRFRLAHPELFGTYVREHGHVMLGARHGLASVSSARFTKVLDRLEQSGELVKVKGPGTGAWRQNQSIGYWARPPRPTGAHLTWSMFCAAKGRSIEWTEDDRAPFEAS